MTEHRDPFGEAFASWAKACETAGSQDGLLGLAMQIFDPRHWPSAGWISMEQPLEAILGLPRFAFPMLDRKLLALGGGWILLLQRSGEHGLKVVRAWSEAYTEFLVELNRAADEGKPVHAGRELFDRWITLLNRKIQGLQRSEEFLASQRRLMEALLSSRSRERELVELIANAFDLPTRTEIDDAHRSVHDLKREVRALRREIDELKANDARVSSTIAPLRRAPARPQGAARARGGRDGASHPT